MGWGEGLRPRHVGSTLSPAAEELRAAAREYLNEMDCPAPDYTLRRILRERLANALAAVDAVHPQPDA